MKAAPDEDETPPFAMPIPDSPHWPLGRCRAERDRLATEITMREPTLSDRVEASKWEPWTKGRKLSRDFRGKRGAPRVRRFVLLARMVLALEAGAPPRKSSS